MGAKHRYEALDTRRWFINGRKIPFETDTRIYKWCLYVDALSSLDQHSKFSLKEDHISIFDLQKEKEYDLVFRDQFEKKPPTHRYKGRLLKIINTSFNDIEGHVLWFSINPNFPEGGLISPSCIGQLEPETEEKGEQIVTLNGSSIKPSQERQNLIIKHILKWMKK